MRGRDQLRRARRAELGQQVRDVPLDGAVADEEPGADLAVAEAVGDEPQDLGLAGGEPVGVLRSRLDLQAGAPSEVLGPRDQAVGTDPPAVSSATRRCSAASSRSPWGSAAPRRPAGARAPTGTDRPSRPRPWPGPPRPRCHGSAPPRPCAPRGPPACQARVRPQGAPGRGPAGPGPPPAAVVRRARGPWRPRPAPARGGWGAAPSPVCAGRPPTRRRGHVIAQRDCCLHEADVERAEQVRVDDPGARRLGAHEPVARSSTSPRRQRRCRPTTSVRKASMPCGRSWWASSTKRPAWSSRPSSDHHLGGVATAPDSLAALEPERLGDAHALQCHRPRPRPGDRCRSTRTAG